MRGGVAALVLLAAIPARAFAFTWTARADVLGEQFGIGLHAGGTIGNKIYLAGGGYIGTSLWGSYRSARVFDPVTDTWTQIAPMSKLRATPGSAVALFQGAPRLYVIGGMDLTDFPIDHFTHPDIEEYDPVADTWRVVGAGMPAGLSTWGTCAVVVDNKIHVMGGIDDSFSGPTRRLAAYDPDSDSWTSLALMPFGVSDGACAVVGRRIYWIGGYDTRGLGWGSLPQADVFVYDVDLDQWSTAPGVAPTPRANAAAIAVGTRIFVVGGWDGGGTYRGMFNTTDVYDTVTGAWAGDVPDALGCIADDGASVRGRAGFTLHEANDGTALRVFAAGGNIGISIPTRCNESSPRPSTTIDTDPPTFAGLGSATETQTCGVPPLPQVRLDWVPGTDASPPVVYDVFRGTSPTFIPDASTLIAARVTGPPYLDTLSPADCLQSLWYLVRAQDSATPPNTETNLGRVQVDLLCAPAAPPTGIGNRLLLVRDASGAPVLDWSTFVPGVEVTHYHVRRTSSKSALPGNVQGEPTAKTYTDVSAPGAQYLYQIRTATGCEAESLD